MANTSFDGQSPAPSVAEIKNGKVHFKQKITSFEKQSETLQEIVQFRDMLTSRVEKQETPLDSIPEDHRPVIAKLAHESDKTLAALSKHIRLELLPTDDDEDGPRDDSSPTSIALPLNVVEAAIKSIMQRNNYGLDGLGGGRPPAAVCIWRWEVKPQHWDWLPKSAREKAEARQKEREQAKEELSKAFHALAQDEQDKILDPKGTLKTSNKDTPNHDNKASTSAAKENQPSPAKSISSKKDTDEDAEPNQKSKGKSAKVVDPEKVSREQEKAEKKAAKAEKEKKELDAKKKSQSLMANFFTKPKKAPTNQTTTTTSNEAGPSAIRSEFTKYFKPFVIKKDATLAPTNYFSRRRREKQPTPDDDVIIVDEEDPVVTVIKDPPTPEEVSSMPVTGHLRSIVSHFSSPLRQTPLSSSYKLSGGFKTYTPLPIRDIFSRLSEAEVTGDTNLVRTLHSQLSDRTKFPAKVLIFHEDGRPGYFGTWTRNSRIIGPRTPLGKDVLVFDYGYDSGEEWEAEPAGDADDVMDEGEDEDGDGDEQDSDLDSWLVDDDDDELDGPISIDDRDLSPSLLPDLLPRTGKRKTDEVDKKAGKKRRVVIPLVPFSKGPCWETSIDRSEEFMDPFRIQLFNDAPFPLNPFTYSAPVEKPHTTQSSATSSNDGGFVVPNLPVRLLNWSTAPSTTSSAEPSPTANGPKKAAPAAKTAFPDALLPLLLNRINALQSKTITFLVDSIHQDLKGHNVKKNAIEAKVREVGEKSKDTKFWVVKPGIQAPS